MLRYHLAPFLRYTTPRKLVNFLLIKLQKWLRFDHVRGLPYRYHIDPTNICNLRCPVCPTGLGILGRDRGKMSMEGFRVVVDQIAKFAYVLELYNWGEPLLHPQIVDMVEYAHRSGISVRLSSNMNVFSRDMAERIVASGLDRLIVSVDGSTQEVYSEYRRGGDLERVLGNISKLVEEKEQQNSVYPFILMRMLVGRHNEHQVEDLRQIAHAMGVDAFSTGAFFIDTKDEAQAEKWLPTDEAQSFYQYSTELKNVWHCSDLWESMVVNWDGGVAPCCWLHRKEYDFGSALETPISEIWNSRSYINSRRVLSGKAPLDGSETICMVCRGQPRYLRD